MTPNRPQLPSGYAWITRLEDAEPALADGVIPLLHPGDSGRAQRWAGVLHTYPPPGGGGPRGVGAGARVMSPPGHHLLGRYAAAALGRPHHHLDPTRPAGPGGLGPAGGSVLLTAPGPALPLAVLMPLLNAAAGQGTMVGVLTGRDEAAVVFHTAKTLAARTATGPVRTALVDGTTGLAHLLTPGHRDEPATHTRVLGEVWEHLIVDADGSAAHAPLGAVTLCGLTTPAEHTCDGVPLPGGCTPGRCKTDPAGIVRPLAPHTLRTQVLGLFVCNAITLGPGEQYPSDVGLALDALDGHPHTVLGLLRGDLHTSSREPRLAAASLNAGHRLGRTAALLDTDGHQRGIRGPSVLLLGDPEHHPTTPGTGIPAVPPPVSAGGRTPPVEPGLWPQRFADADAFEQALRHTLTRRPDPQLAACLDEMTAHRTRALHALHAAVRDRTPLHDWEPALDGHSHHWTRTALEILTRTRSGAFARQLTAARAHHHTTRHTPTSPCPHCHAPRETEHLTSPLHLTSRNAVTCPQCGPALSHPTTFTPLTTRAPAVLRPGATAEIAVELPDGAGGLLAVQIRPRSTRLGPYDHAVHPAAPGRHTIRLTVPATGTVAELDRLWTVHAHRFHLAHHQHRIPLTP